jgi:DNA-binding transcriptional regulator YbjK
MVVLWTAAPAEDSPIKTKGRPMDREGEIKESIDAVLAQLKVQEMALVELMQGLSLCEAKAVEQRLRVRVSDWMRNSESQLTPQADERVAGQLARLLCALGQER